MSNKPGEPNFYPENHAPMILDKVDRAKFDRLDMHDFVLVPIVDQITGEHFYAGRTTCGLDCRCAAVVFPVDDEPIYQAEMMSDWRYRPSDVIPEGCATDSYHEWKTEAWAEVGNFEVCKHCGKVKGFE